MGNKIDPEKFVGQIYGRLTTVSVDRQVGRYVKGIKEGYRYYMKCECVCGNTKIISLSDLKSGHTQSCGCILSEMVSKRSKKHGDTAGHKLSKEWVTWNSMNERCHKPYSTSYVNYGAKGIIVCERWRGEDGFKNFLSDMGRKPSLDHTIDRIDNSLGYEPSNCRWATREQQSNNQTSNVKVIWKGKSYNISQLMRKLGISTKSGVYYSRIKRGWDVEAAFYTPIHPCKRKA